MAGIYIHIPFCRQACTYCNFHFSTSLLLKNDLLGALGEEIQLSKDFIPSDEPIHTIYFGGGTPSLLTAGELQSILSTIGQKFILAPGMEITLEANPDDINPMVLSQWQDLGINRLSLGVQSFNEQELKWMNRAHTASQSLESIDAIIAAGFINFSVDLIYGSPWLSNEDLEKNARTIISKNIPHISCYALTVEPRTALDHMIKTQKSLPVNPDKQAEQFHLLLSLLENAGYEQYEISNFALPGYRSRHNSSYWNGNSYYGFGPAAHSFNGINRRRWNISNNALYIQSIRGKEVPFEEEQLTTKQLINEYIMTSLRTVEGLDPTKLALQLGEEEIAQLLLKSKKYIDEQLMQVVNGNLVLTREGKFLADGIAAELFF